MACREISGITVNITWCSWLLLKCSCKVLFPDYLHRLHHCLSGFQAHANVPCLSVVLSMTVSVTTAKAFLLASLVQTSDLIKTGQSDENVCCQSLHGQWPPIYLYSMSDPCSHSFHGRERHATRLVQVCFMTERLWTRSQESGKFRNVTPITLSKTVSCLSN